MMRAPVSPEAKRSVKVAMVTAQTERSTGARVAARPGAIRVTGRRAAILASMSEPAAPIPQAVLDLARRRASARRSRDWALADDLKARIEAAGWRVVDSGPTFRLAPAIPPDVREPGRTLFGSAAAVPSRLDAPAAGPATFVVHLDRGLADAGGLRSLEALAEHAPRGSHAVIVADAASVGRPELLDTIGVSCGTRPAEVDDPAVGSVDQEPGEEPASAAPGVADRDAICIEVLWTSRALGPAASLEAGARRACADTIVVLAPDVVLEGDVVGPIRSALDDPAVAVVGSEGLVSGDLHHLEVASPGPVTALGSGCLAFRRAELSERGPLDARLTSPAGVAAWWSLALREPWPGVSVRRAVALDLPLHREGSPGDEAGEAHGGAGAAARDPDGRRDRYRIAARFAEHRDVLVMTPEGEPSGEPA